MRILIVEDEKEIRNFLKKNLEAECFAVDTASDGEDGLYKAKINDYDLFIFDNCMPKMTGLELCSEIRKNQMTVPILFLSVKSETDIKVRALDAGADDYLIKPFSLSELIARVRALLRRKPQMSEEILAVDDLILDTKKHTVHKDNTEIILTRKEFMLLQYFMENQGFVLSRGMILEHVWDMNADPFSNTIESHILSLRKKIGVDSKSNLIKTISGRGYRFGK